ncbi:MAG: endonuclease/exonuclease/phosphatase family protein, partial [bacterium]
RIMTYNVHGCRGMDGKLSPERIARIIIQYNPDIVALQELDVGRMRSGEVDQAREIAEDLRMDFFFHPAIQMEEEKYGDAILSRYPIRLVRAEGLPNRPRSPDGEPRGALWVEVSAGGRAVQFVTTHLSLDPRERMLQAGALLGEKWIGSKECRGPVVLCGDFNALPKSPTCRLIQRSLRDAQRELDGHRPKRTWSGRYPVGRIDHVFVGDGIEVLNVEVPRKELTRVASDHLPLIVEAQLS